MKYENVMLGSDPEMVLYDPRKKRFHSVEGLIGGTKEEPRPIEGFDGFFVQEDNLAVEGNISPAKSSEEFADSIDILKKQIVLMIPEYSLRIVPSAVFDKEFLDTDQAREFGCQPDMNAYSGEMNPLACVPKDNLGLRSFGGHIHISYDDAWLDEKEDKQAIARAMDIYTGLPSLLEDEDKMRRELYGAAGSYREKEYGLEYRSLSNYWVKSKELSKTIFERTIKALAFVTDMGITHNDTRVQKAINTHDVDLAEKLILEYGVA